MIGMGDWYMCVYIYGRWKSPWCSGIWTLRWLTMSGGGNNHRDVKPLDNIAPRAKPLNSALKRPENKKQVKQKIIKEMRNIEKI